MLHHKTLLKAVLVLAFVTPPPLLKPFSDVGLGGSSANAQPYVSPVALGNGLGADANNAMGFTTLVANAASGGIASGSNIRFLSGNYEGTLDLRGVQNVTLQPVAGATAVFSGSAAVSDAAWNGPVTWAATGATNVYWIHLADIGASSVFNVYDDNALRTNAREPDEGNWFRTDHYTPPTQFTDAEIAATGVSWQGGAVVLRYANWGYAVRSIAAHTAGSNTVTHSSTGGSNVSDGAYDWGYFVQNHAAALDQPSEWFVDLTDSQDPRLYYIAPNGGQPSGVRVAIRQRGIVIQQRINGTTVTPSSNIVVDGLAFEHFSDAYYTGGGDPNPLGAGMKVKFGSSNITIRNCTFRDSRFGIDDEDGATNSTQLTYENNSFERIYRNAIRSGGQHVTIRGNTLADIGTVPGQAGTDFGGNSAMNILADDMKVSGNSFYNTGGAAITAQGFELTPGEHYIRNNMIRDASSMLNDHGGISIDLCVGLRIEQNLINGMVPDVLTASQGQYKDNKTVGIYFGDKYIRNTTVQGNVVTRCGTGIRVDHSRCSEAAIIRDNTLFNNGTQLSIADYSNYQTAADIGYFLGQTVSCGGIGDIGQGTGNANYQASFSDQYSRNIMYCLSSAQRCMEQDHVWPSSYATRVSFGTFSNNYYFQPFNTVPIFQRFHFTNGATGFLGDREVPWTLHGWMANMSTDAGSTASPLRLKDYAMDPNYTETEITSLGDDFENGIGSWNVSGCTNNTVTWNTNAMRTACDWIERFSTPHYFEIGTGYQGSIPDISPSTFRFTFRMRSATTDAIRFNPVFATYNNNTQYWSGSNRYFGLTEHGGTPHECVISVPDVSTDDYLVGAFQNVQRSLGALPGAGADVDDFHVFQTQLLSTYPAQIAQDHQLWYNYDLPSITTDPQNVASNGGTFTVPGDPGQCWSDVYGTFYAAGDPIALEPWASIVLFRFDPPQTEGTANTETPLNGDVLWTEHTNILGRITVEAGSTLTIDGAHIGFEPSTPQFANNLTVKPGGTLVLKNGATLRSWMGCDGVATMWDGVKALGAGTTQGAGLVIMESGARIADAYTAIRCAEGSPTNPLVSDGQSGGIVQADGAIFENNLYDIVTLPHGDIDPGTYGPSAFTNTTFRRTRALNDPNYTGHVHVSLMSSAPTEFIGCTFDNTTSANPTTPSGWGMGLQAIDTRIRVADDEAGEHRGTFKGLNTGILHASYSPTTTADIDGCDFVGNARGALLYGSNGSRIVRSTFQVPDLAVSELDVPAAYGSYLYGCSGFEVEENSYTGMGGTDHPKVGAIFRNTNTTAIDDNASNEFYRNSFNGFAGAGISAGTIIMGRNRGTDTGSGIHFRCNQYSNTSVNDHDVAFTSSTATIGRYQGVNDLPTTLAANTFANYDEACGDGTNDDPERHLYVHPDSYASVEANIFEYWHHHDVAGSEYRPHCDSDPIVVDVDIVLDWIKESNYFYTPDACPLDLSRDQDINDVLTDLEAVADEHEELAEVYADWSDGGDYPGLKDFILDPANSSYAVRNQLMIVAPKVSHANWEHAFFRTPALDPWHLAQALIANSPLTKETLALLDSTLVNPYYKQLVRNAQDGSISMHTIYQSELSHLYGRTSRAACDAVKLAQGDAELIGDAIAIIAGTAVRNKPQLLVGLYLAKGDAGAAHAIIDTMRAAEPGDDYWRVQGMLADLHEQDLHAADVDANGIAALEQIAGGEKAGCGQAQAWLALLGEPFVEPIVLPTLAKRRKPAKPAAEAAPWHPLGAFPNPSKGPVSIVYEVPGSVEDAQLRVMDALGRLVHQQRVAGSGIVQLDLQRSMQGLLVIGLYYDEHLIGTEKLHLVR